MTTAIICVDLQNDFCEGGSLAVTGGAAVAAAVATHIRTVDYGLRVATRDWHTKATVGHFADERDDDPEARWPVHCMAGSVGAEYQSDFAAAVDELPFVEIRKGETAAAYSGFEGAGADGDLAGVLTRAGVTDVTVVGLATDHCVRATALDAAAWARARGATVRVRLDLCAAVSDATAADAVAELRAAGVEVGP